MPASEIDDIFAGKLTAKKIQIGDALLPRDPASVKGKKRKKSKKAETVEATQEPLSIKKTKPSKAKESSDKVTEEVKLESKKRKRTPPQEIVDSALPAKRRKSEQTISSKSKKKAEKDSIQKFKDSRGGSGRKRTDDGFFIYTEEELGLNKAGGDTPLCPFDCECCY